jgi:hypothetical protein
MDINTCTRHGTNRGTEMDAHRVFTGLLMCNIRAVVSAGALTVILRVCMLAVKSECAIDFGTVYSLDQKSLER